MKIAKRSEILSELEKLCQAYRMVFQEKNPYVDVVVADLVRFCRARETEFHQDQRVHALLSGRRDVWLRIEQFTMDDAEAILARTTQPILDPQPSKET